jgi:FkbM family methyltransferase
MVDRSTNAERTAEYLKRFSREKTLEYLLGADRPVIFDVGANIGDSLEEFKSWWPGATVHCFEPQSECWDSLEERARRLGPDTVVINRFAAGSQPTDHAVFYSHDIHSGVSGFNRINIQSSDSVALGKIRAEGQQAVQEYQQTLNHERTVPIVRMDDYLGRTGIPRVNLLKIDTQGFEPEVLEGFGQRLADVDVVLTELMFYDYYERSLSFSDIERFLHPAGLRLYDISHIAKNPLNGRTDWVDAIYVHERIRKSS